MTPNTYTPQELTPEELRARVITHGWDADWVESIIAGQQMRGAIEAMTPLPARHEGHLRIEGGTIKPDTPTS